jgi:hypothetical protein
MNCWCVNANHFGHKISLGRPIFILFSSEVSSLCGKENGEQGAIRQATQVLMMIMYYYKACIWMTMMMKKSMSKGNYNT